MQLDSTTTFLVGLVNREPMSPTLAHTAYSGAIRYDLVPQGARCLFSRVPTPWYQPADSTAKLHVILADNHGSPPPVFTARAARLVASMVRG